MTDKLKPVIGEFVKITFGEDGIEPYPYYAGQELMVLYNGEYIHCIAVIEHDCLNYDKTYLVVVPFNEDNHTGIEYENVDEVAFIEYRADTVWRNTRD